MARMPRITATTFAKLADSLVGLAYILGTPTPYNLVRSRLRSLDCSGVVVWLMYWSGNGIGDTTAAGLYAHTTAVSPGDEKPGDLVFLRNNPKRSNGIGHVAILTKRLAGGGWRIIEARGRRWGVVRTTLAYWKTRNHYTGVRRYTGFVLLPDPAGVAPVAYPPTLRKGSKGKWVGRLQKELNHDRNSKLTVDNQFGAKTEAAVKALEKAKKLTVNGVAGPSVWKRLGVTA